MRFICDHCYSRQIESREPLHLEFERYDEWISHILSKAHQGKVAETYMTLQKWENKRFIVVTAFLPPVPKPLEVLDYFSRFGMICEFYYPRDMNFCVLRVDPLVSNMKAWNTVEGHIIKGNPVKVFEMASMTALDWESININQSQNRPVPANKIENAKIHKKVSRPVPVMNSSSSSLVRDDSPLSQEAVVDSLFKKNRGIPGMDSYKSSQGTSTSQASSVTSNGFKQNHENRSRRTRRKNRKSKERAVLNKEKPSCESIPPIMPEIQKVSCDLKEISTNEKPDVVQFRGGFNIGPRPQIPATPSVISSIPIPTVQPLPQHNPGTASIPNILINTNFSQIQNHRHPANFPHQNAQPSRYSGPSKPRYQEIIRPSQQLPRMQPPPLFYQHQYGQRMPNMPFNEAQQFSPNQTMRPRLPPGAFPNNFQAVRPHNQAQPSFRKLPQPKFVNLFYKMVNDPVAVRNSQLCETYEALPAKDQFREFLLALSLDEEGKRNREGMLQDLRQILVMDFPNCMVYPFGSFLTGLGDLESDVDVYVDVYGVTRGRQLPKTESSTLDILNRCRLILRRAKCPRSNKPFCNQLIPIREARVPILKLRHSLTSVNCDLSFENLISVRNSELINLYMRLHPVVRPLIVMIRYWGKFHNLTGSNSIKNYGLILLVLVFLGIKKVVPSIQFLQKVQETERKKSAGNKSSVKNPDIIDDWDTSFCDNVDQIKSIFPSSLSIEEAGGNLVKAVEKLAQDFFTMYAEADLVTSVICSYTSEFLPKSLFSAGNEEDLPETLDRYKEWSSKQTSERRLNIKTSLCIQDPFILSFNVGSVTPSGITLKFQVACSQTAKQLQSSNLQSFLDVFIPLPKEVGDHKFMTMQNRQKLTIKLSKEISNYIKNGTTDIPEDSETASQETIPLHLLPLEKILDKNTIRFGKGWESFSSFQADNDFQALFVQQIKAHKLINFRSPRILLQKLKVLWIGFVEDFLSEFWEKSLGLAVTQEERVHLQRTFADAPFSVKGRKNYEALFAEKVKKDKKSTSKNEGPPEDKVQQLKIKLLELDELQERIIYKKVTCTAFKPIWQKREKALKQVTSKTGGPLVAEKTSSKASVESKKNLRKKKKIKKVESSTNPLDIEEEITKVLLTNSKADTEEPSSDKPLLQFVSFIKFDCSLVDDLPEIFFIFEKTEGTKFNYGQGVSTFVEILTTALPQYMLFRLKKWLDIRENEAPESENTNNMTTDSKTESIPEAVNPDAKYDEEYDLVMPPSSSSSSECSEAPVPADVED